MSYSPVEPSLFWVLFLSILLVEMEISSSVRLNREHQIHMLSFQLYSLANSKL